MQRFAWLALALGACGSEVDDRPATLPIIVENILIPNCGTSQCHSTMTQQYGLVFDNLAGARASLVGLVTAGDPSESQLISNLTIDDSANNAPRMPYDQPLQDVDLILIENWIANGAYGAQCAPAGVDYCNLKDNNVYSCTDGVSAEIAACDSIHGCTTLDADGNTVAAHCLVPAS